MFIFIFSADNIDFSCARKQNIPYVLIYDNYNTYHVQKLSKYSQSIISDIDACLEKLNPDVLILDFNISVCIFNLTINKQI